MSVAEKYLRAARSSHLEMKVEAGDLDVLIAAGMVQCGIGTDLIRLRSERDSTSKLPGARLAMPLLKSMGRTKERLTRYAADELHLDASSEALAAIISRVIDLYLDPTCQPCSGTGKTGAYGAAMPMCQACRGSTRRDVMWPDKEAEGIAQWLQARMEEKVDSALRRMARLLRTN
jgi:hypothetical protein